MRTFGGNIILPTTLTYPSSPDPHSKVKHGYNYEHLAEEVMEPWTRGVPGPRHTANIQRRRVL